MSNLLYKIEPIIYNKPMKKKDDIIRLLKEGLPYNEIAKQLHCSKSTISFHAAKLEKPAHLNPDPQKAKAGNRYNWEEISAYIEMGHGYKDCAEKFGLSPATWQRAIKKGMISYKGRGFSLEELLVAGRYINTSGFKKRLIDAGLLEDRCSQCGITEWQDKPISLQLDHINGDNTDNRLENLRILCPNCHSQTDTYGSRNRQSVKASAPGKRKCTDCKKMKSLSDFHMDRRARMGVQCICKECAATLSKERIARRNG